MRSQLNPLVVITGPTAVGKTEVALQVAEAVSGEIISADSRLFYKGMDIGTAKPTLEERARVPHHLIDLFEVDQPWSLAGYQAAAPAVIQQVQQRGRLPLLVGGTGQYIHAVVEGWLPPAHPADTKLRAILEVWGRQIGPEELHRRLAVIDPVAADVIDAPNLRRTVRALEVIFSSGERFSDQRRKNANPYNTLMIGLTRPREELYARVDARIDSMLAAGFVDEVRRLLAKGYSADLPTFSAIGYREIIAYLQGKMTLEEAVVLMKRYTRRYVRQQGAWFREEDPRIHWFRVEDDTAERVAGYILGWLGDRKRDQ
jgi:tRNA dimethylallyltransferase